VAGVRCLKMPKWSPNLHSFAESWVRAAKRECLDKIVFSSERQIRYVVEQYVEHHYQERPHKGRDYRRPVEPATPPPRGVPIKCPQRLGDLLKSYYREAA